MDKIQFLQTELETIRYSKLDNPLTHIFKKNKLVDTLQGKLSWTRDSGATYIDRYGVLQYSPSPHATNLITYSEDFSNAAWIKTGTTASITTGLYTANGLQFNKLESDFTGTGPREVRDAAIVSTGRVTTSFYVKSAELDNIVIRYDVPTVVDCRVRFNTSDLTSAGNTNAINTNYKLSVIEEYVDGTVRVAVSFDSPDTGACTIRIWLQDAYQDIGSSSDLNIGDGIFITAIQLEESRVANGYIKTEATQVTGSSYVGIEVAREEQEGWLIEGSSTNLLTYSEDFSNAAWVKQSGATIISDVTPSPDTVTLADKLYTTVSSNTEYIRVSESYTSGTSYNISIYAKKGEFDVLYIDGTSAVWGDPITTYFDLTLGVVDIVGNGVNSANIEELANGWFRCSVAATAMSTATNAFGLIYGLCDNVGDKAATATANDGLYLWGATLETLPFASSYIPTTSAPVTRAAELVNHPVSNNVPNGSFSYVVDLNQSGAWINNARIFSWLDVRGSETRLQYQSSGQIRFYINTVLYTFVIPTEINGVFVVVFDEENSLGTIYVDGVRLAQTAISDVNTPDTTQIVSYATNNYSAHYGGQKMLDFALTPEEVAFISGE